MYFNQNDLTINKIINIKQIIKSIPDNYKNLFHNVAGIKEIKLDGQIRYFKEGSRLETDIKVSAQINVISALSNNIFDYKFDFLWKDEYNFNVIDSLKSNLILDPEGFFLEGYALDETFMRIPLNLSLPGEREKFKKINLDSKKKDQIDPRWSDLKKINIK
ncbi:hypothetical protein [Spiroplasma endosymbiont of Amphibalanus improvisus]|uniref:hypothetical protein n=1 Tax=Spiroplasma endosymbiont of Amphibalanus improvisus TaxID=3066327 RepID=UPI00313C57B2